MKAKCIYCRHTDETTDILVKDAVVRKGEILGVCVSCKDARDKLDEEQMMEQIWSNWGYK